METGFQKQGLETLGSPPAGRRVTIQDVARYCGLSKGAVSKALKYELGEGPLNRETQRRVIDAAQALGYRPDWRARALASRRTSTIGMLYIPPRPPTGGIYGGIFNAFSAALTDANYHLLLVPVSDRNRDWCDILESRRLDGCVIFEAPPPGVEESLRTCGLPTVLVNADTSLPFPAILVDDHGGAVRATRHLIEHGHQRIAFFHGPEQMAHHSIEARIAGYRDAMTHAGLAAYIDVVDSELDPYADALAARTGRRPTAIVTYIHHFAIDLLGELTRRGVRVPQDISLITFNDEYPLGRLAPRISAMSLPAEAMGKMAARLLLEQIAQDAAPLRQRVLLDEELVARESVVAPPPEKAT